MPKQKAAPTKLKQKIGQACYACHLRKVKCDLATCGNTPCTRCSQLDISCRRFTRKQRKGRVLKGVLEDFGTVESSVSRPTQVHESTAATTSDDFYSLGVGDSPRHVAITGLGDFQSQNSILVDFLSQDFSRESIAGYQVTFNDDYSNISRTLGNEFGHGFKAGVHHHRDAPFVKTSQAGLPRTLAAAERGILDLQGAFSLPSQSVADSFVTAFFDRVYPTLPIVDRADFMRRYYTMGSETCNLSLLLLHSIFLAGSATYRHPGLKLPASEVSKRLYIRAKAMVENRFEQDRLILVQAHLLFSTFASDSCDDTVQNMWLSIGTAARIAQGLGMHRSLGKANAGPAMRRAWKRIWWTLFVHDTLCSFEWGRPRAIHLDDCDVDPLEDSDFEPEETGALPNAEASQFLTSICSLCFIIGDWLNVLRPGIRRQTVLTKEDVQREREVATAAYLEQLSTWHENIPAILKPPLQLENFSYWAATLHITYCATTLRFAALLPDKKETVYAMASQITDTCQSLESRGLLYSLWNFGIHELDLAMGQHARQANSTESDVAAVGLQRLQTGLPLIKMLSARSSVAAQGSEFYEKLVEKVTSRLDMSQEEDSSGMMPAESEPEPDWLYGLDLNDLAFADWVPQINHPWGWDIE